MVQSYFISSCSPFLWCNAPRVVRWAAAPVISPIAVYQATTGAPTLGYYRTAFLGIPEHRLSAPRWAPPAGRLFAGCNST